MGHRRRVTGCTGSQTSSSRALSRAAASIPVNTRTSSNASCGRCWGQPQIVDAKLQPAGQLDRAHDEVNREFGLGDLGLRSEKRIVERDIVRDQSAPAQHVDNLTGDIGELWLVIEHGGGQAVHVGGARVHLGI